MEMYVGPEQSLERKAPLCRVEESSHQKSL